MLITLTHTSHQITWRLGTSEGLLAPTCGSSCQLLDGKTKSAGTVVRTPPPGLSTRWLSTKEAYPKIRMNLKSYYCLLLPSLGRQAASLLQPSFQKVVTSLNGGMARFEYNELNTHDSTLCLPPYSIGLAPGGISVCNPLISSNLFIV